jgi:uncharacterized protein (UPF0276 family)
MTHARQALVNTGVGLRLPHLSEIVVTRPEIAWLEIHPENFLASPHATELLCDVADRYPMSVHTVGVSIGSDEGGDRLDLERVRALVDRLDPALVSGHLAWSTHEGDYLNDLLPLPYNDETLAVLAAHLDVVQDALGRPFLVENPSSYVGFGSSTMVEVEFLGQLVQRTSCQLLCDVSNMYVSAHNMGYDPYQYIYEFPASAVAELHLGGFTPEPDGRVDADVGALVALPPNRQAVVTLRDIEGMGSEEVCQVLGVSDANHRVLLAALQEHYGGRQ